MVEDDGRKEDEVKVKNVLQGKFPDYDAVKEKGQGQSEHIVFSGGQTQKISPYFGEWIHRGHALVIQESGLLLFGGDCGIPTCSEKHEIKPLQAQKKREGVTGSFDRRGIVLFHLTGLRIVAPTTVGFVEVGGEIDGCGNNQGKKTRRNQVFDPQSFPYAAQKDRIHRFPPFASPDSTWRKRSSTFDCLGSKR